MYYIDYFSIDADVCAQNSQRRSCPNFDTALARFSFEKS